ARNAATTTAGTFSFASKRAMSHLERVDSLSLEGLGRVVQGSLDVFLGQLRVVAQDLRVGPVLGQQFDEELYGDPRAGDDGLAHQDSGVHSDAILPVHGVSFRRACLLCIIPHRWQRVCPVAGALAYGRAGRFGGVVKSRSRCCSWAKRTNSQWLAKRRA